MKNQTLAETVNFGKVNLLRNDLLMLILGRYSVTFSIDEFCLFSVFLEHANFILDMNGKSLQQKCNTDNFCGVSVNDQGFIVVRIRNASFCMCKKNFLRLRQLCSEALYELLLSNHLNDKAEKVIIDPDIEHLLKSIELQFESDKSG